MKNCSSPAVMSGSSGKFDCLEHLAQTVNETRDNIALSRTDDFQKLVSSLRSARSSSRVSSILSILRPFV